MMKLRPRGNALAEEPLVFLGHAPIALARFAFEARAVEDCIGKREWWLRRPGGGEVA